MNAVLRYVASALLALTVASGDCASKEMSFAFVGNGGNCNGCEWVSAEGDIVNATPAAFEKFVFANRLKNYWLTIYINSAGGDPFSAMRLGELVRKFHWDIAVGSTKPFGKMFGTENTYDIGKGKCEDACVLAFFGGEDRHAEAKELGFKPFKPPQKWVTRAFRANYVQSPTPQELFLAHVSDYVHRMGVDSALMPSLHFGADGKVLHLSKPELDTLRVNWSPGDYQPWSAEAYKAGAIAYSRSNDGKSQATLFCRKDGSVHLVIAAEIFNENPDWPKAISTTSDIDLFGTELPDGSLRQTSSAGRSALEVTFSSTALDHLKTGPDVYTQAPMISLSAMSPRVFQFYFNFSFPAAGAQSNFRLALKNCVD